MQRFVLVVACGLLWLDLCRLAIACDYSLPDTLEIQSDPQDVTAPAAPRASVERVKRGREPQRDGCSYQSSSCDDTAYLLLNVDVQAEPAQVGYLLEVKGKSPGFQGYLQRPLVASGDPGQLRLVWEDGEGHAHYDFDIYVWMRRSAARRTGRRASLDVACLTKAAFRARKPARQRGA